MVGHVSDELVTASVLDQPEFFQEQKLMHRVQQEGARNFTNPLSGTCVKGCNEAGTWGCYQGRKFIIFLGGLRDVPCKNFVHNIFSSNNS